MDTAKRAAEDLPEGEEAEAGPPRPPADEDEEADVGPAPPKPKKRKVLQFEQQYLEALPCAQMYEKSYMHRDTVSHVVATSSDFIITGSIDGHLKFWKKQEGGIEFVKHYRAHLGSVDGLAASDDGALCASVSRDGTVKVFDVLTFDMIVMMKLPYVPGVVEWLVKPGDARSRLAISDLNSPAIHVYDVRSGSDDPVGSVTSHAAPVTAMRYCPAADIAVSTDQKGFIEYWAGTTLKQPPPGALSFSFKLDTDLFVLAQSKTHARSLDVSRDGAQFAAFCADGRVRVWRLRTGKLSRIYDESLEAAHELQKSGPEALQLEDIDFGRRYALEKEMRAQGDAVPAPSVIFDESGNFLLYPTLLGVKAVNLVTNGVARLLGKVENSERFLKLALYQGVPKKVKARAHSADVKLPTRDPTLVATAYRKQRLYLFTRREPADAEDAAAGRDVFNEKPNAEELLAGDGAGGAASSLPRGAVLRTTKGDVTLRLFPDECPRTVENFTTHARNGYYDGVIFHRIIKGFMLQTGDPLGDGTGGESIWGGEFEDEIHKTLRHDRPGILSMANAGPNTNGSQFFITTVPTPWLDGKHTVFGRVAKGRDVVGAIEKAKTGRGDKPVDDIKIINIDLVDSVEEGG
ncbi:peptidyl-prolyl cis-trans isomerase [Raphidocelis subcapitata]|uniref:peptidylprolyl isomerase n=1 Tax=Raphidocelis subcapitata TaxID=307507 RepID=A0A2V0PM29_9CHLO|nr:peptidyl-prolyl cis-trans isomerase [Raphidocelis subcapitata]|eukprot:GBF99133.1 peptidyl-prolyl cis-trans isomerase [Raphidocelis subcapitata]